jgi:hypothetical protein
MQKIILIYFLTCLIIFSASAQLTYIEPFLGYKINMSSKVGENTSVVLHQIYTGVQLSRAKRENYEYACQLSIGIPIAKKYFDSSFTLNTSLPLYAPANKMVKAFSVSTSFIQKLKLFYLTKNDKVNLLINTGLTFQNLKVSYGNDKNNYVILNPDKTQNSFGVSVGLGLQCIHTLKKGRVFIQSDANLPILTKRNKYPTLLKALYPFTISTGYSFEL